MGVLNATTNVVVKIIPGPDTDHPSFVFWRNNVISDMSNKTYRVLSLVTPTGITETVSSNILNPQWVVASTSENPSWQGVFPPPAGFEGSTGTCLWMWLDITGDSLTLSSITGVSSSTDGLLNGTHSFSNFSSGVVGWDATGAMITNGSGSIPMKRIILGIKMKSFVASSQSVSNQIVTYINSFSNFETTMSLQGLDGTNPWSVSRTLSTKIVPSPVGAKIAPASGGWVIEGSHPGLIMAVDMTTDLGSTWVRWRSVSPGEKLPLLESGESKRFYRLVTTSLP